MGAEEGSVTSLDLSGRSNPRLDSLPHTLTCIDLSRCRLESLDALRQLRALELLNVSFNRLTSLAPVANATRLSVLYARSNRLRSLEPLAQLAGSLTSVDLDENALATVEALAPLWRLGELNELRLKGNPVSHTEYRRECRQRLPRLRVLDGVSMDVSTDVSMDVSMDVSGSLTHTPILPICHPRPDVSSMSPTSCFCRWASRSDANRSDGSRSSISGGEACRSISACRGTQWSRRRSSRSRR